MSKEEIKKFVKEMFEKKYISERIAFNKSLKKSLESNFKDKK